MKSLITVMLLGLSGILVNQASAEPFNDRSLEWSTVISSGHAAMTSLENRQTLAGAGFNDRGEDWLVAAVPGYGPRECQLGGYFASSYGFNDQSVRQDHLC